MNSEQRTAVALLMLGLSILATVFVMATTERELVSVDMRGASIVLPAIHPASPGLPCRRLSSTIDRVHTGKAVDECDLRNLVEAEEEIGYLREVASREGGWCWDELESCESGVATERACRGFELSRFDVIIADLDACARLSE